MGGCRCSYPNCTVKSDGVTHMFHYPVFDRVRCHQWLVNTNRLEFLNLKVSQLKNRVICQHHFKDSYFMNFKKEKLKFDAVPTEKGPFCDSKQAVDSTTEETPKVYDISLDDIENELICCEDKKANFSVKYGNFLTNCDLISELDTLNQLYKNNAIEERIKEPNNVLIDIDVKDQFVNNVSLYDNLQDSVQYPVNKMPCVIHKVNPNVLSIEFEKADSLEKKQQNNIKANNQVLNYKRNNKNDRKIRIISEKKIPDPVSIIGKLEPVSPSLILRLPDGKKKIMYTKTNEVPSFTRNQQKDLNDLVSKEENYCLNTKQKLQQISKISEKAVSNLSNDYNFLKTSNSSIDIHNNTLNDTQLTKNTVSKKNVTKQLENNASLLTHNIINKKVSQYRQTNVKKNLQQDKPVSLSTNKIPPARVAAIDKKRKFNMKLRDVIESCLDKIDDEDKLSDENKVNNKIEEKIDNKAVYSSKQKHLPKSNDQEYSLAFLEARIKAMEDNLLNKIDQNSQKIVDLKSSFLPVTKNRPNHTLTDEISHKKYLYQEISKYLSPEAKNLIYEELFINKLVQKVPKGSSPAKRRRCR